MQELKLRLSKNNTLNAKVLNPEEFKAEKANLKLVDSSIHDHCITRIFETANSDTILEFFNGSAIQFEKKITIQELSPITFSRILFSHTPDEITYTINIEKDFYELLEPEIVKKVVAKELDFFGEFYILNNENVLVKWSSGFSSTPFSLLKDIRGVASIDPELIDYVDEITVDEEIDYAELLEDDNYEKINFYLEGEGLSTLDEIITGLSTMLNIEKENFDFSLKSIDRIEHSLFWNNDKISKYQLFDLCFPYIGEVARRNFDLSWIESNNSLDLIHKDHPNLEFSSNLGEAIIHNDYGPSVKWVIDTIKSKMK